MDPQSRNKILEGITELNQKGATIIYTSHYMEEVEQICSRILIMDKGKEVASDILCDEHDQIGDRIGKDIAEHDGRPSCAGHKDRAIGEIFH